MTWDDARERYPQSWIVIEAINGRIENAHRIVDDLQVAAVCGADSYAVMKEFIILSRAYPSREYYPVHTGRETLDIEVRAAFGRIPQA
jgi:hypothetical protein